MKQGKPLPCAAAPEDLPQAGQPPGAGTDGSVYTSAGYDSLIQTISKQKETPAMAICLIPALLFLIAGICLLRGKGAWLISGYNTMSGQEKSGTTKKLCRAMGVLCPVCTVLLCAMAYFGHRVDTGSMEEKSMLVFAAVFVVVPVAAIVCTSRYAIKNTRK